MRDPRPASQADKGLLVELGGWFDHLARAELQTVSDHRAVSVSHRLALVADVAVADLARLGASRWVLANLGVTTSPELLPVGAAAALTGSYAIRFHDPGRRLSDADRRSVISAVWRAHAAPRVDLDHPEQDLHVYVTDGGLWFGALLVQCAPELHAQARRPFTRSYELPARKARVLVNLSGAKPGRRFLDPCCGTGSLVVEAARIGCNAYGSDLEVRATQGSATNAAFHGTPATALAADARRLPIATGAIDSVATDLPYGRSARRRGTSGADLYRAVLTELQDTMTAGGRAVLMALHEDTPTHPSPRGWEIAWSCLEDARTAIRSITVWHRVTST